MADESMVPVDQPYGTRGQTKALMGQAGLPLSGLSGGRRVPPAPSPAAAGQAPLSPNAAGPIDFLAERQPAHPMGWTPPDPLANIRNLAQTSPNSYVRAVLTQMLAG